MPIEARKATNEIIRQCEDGERSWEEIAKTLLCHWMSEQEVESFAYMNDLIPEEEEEEE